MEKNKYTLNEDLKTTASNNASEADRPLLTNNFRVMIIAGILIVVGFILMAGAPTTPAEYNPDIFSSRRIVIGPMLSFVGFVVMAIAIIIKPKQK